MVPFHIAVPPDEVSDLQARLDRTRWPAPGGRGGWSTGIDPGYLRSLAGDWRRFDWPAREAALNALPHVTVDVDATTIHALVFRGAGPAPLPLVLTHGWPSSFVEFLPVAAALADPGRHGGDPADAFDIVIPSLPGFGFSPPVAGMSAYGVSRLWPKLMEALGFARWGAHGCDIGAHVDGADGAGRAAGPGGCAYGVRADPAGPAPGAGRAHGGGRRIPGARHGLDERGNRLRVDPGHQA